MREFDRNQTEIKSLRNAHGKLQTVLIEKGSELRHAVRISEVYEREARKMRHKVEVLRKQHQHDTQEKPAAKENKLKVNKIYANNQILNDFGILQMSRSKDNETNIVEKSILEGIYDEVEDAVEISAVEDSKDGKKSK